MAVSIIGPKFYAWDRDGKPLAFGKVYTYKARTNAPQVTYQSEDAVVANTNPVILNGEGYGNIYLDGSYKVVVKDKDDNEIWTADPVTAQGGEEWVNCMTATYLSATTFKISGNVTDSFEVGRRIRIDNNAATYAYSTILSAVFAATDTTITINSPSVTTGIINACTSIVGGESLIGANSAETFAQLRTIEGSYDGQEINLLGHSESGIGGDVFFNNATDTISADNNVTIAATPSGGRWQRKTKGFITPEMGGLAIGSALDQTEIIENVLTVASGLNLPVVADNDFSANIGLANIDIRLSGEASIKPFDRSISALSASASFKASTAVLSVTTVTETVDGNTDLTVSKVAAPGHTLIKGAIVKLVSEDLIPTTPASDGIRNGEWAIVRQVSGSDVYLDRVVEQTYSTSPRIAEISDYVCDVSIKIESTITGVSGGALCAIRGFKNPSLDISVKNNDGLGLFLAGTYGATGTIHAENLTDDSGIGSFGYGVTEVGTGMSNLLILQTGFCRHAYTTGKTSGSSEIYTYGEPWGSTIRGKAHGCSAAAWDTHEAGSDITFLNVESCGSRALLQYRGRRIRFINPIGDYNYTAISSINTTSTTNADGEVVGIKATNCTKPINIKDQSATGNAIKLVISGDSSISYTPASQSASIDDEADIEIFGSLELVMLGNSDFNLWAHRYGAAIVHGDIIFNTMAGGATQPFKMNSDLTVMPSGSITVLSTSIAKLFTASTSGEALTTKLVARNISVNLELLHANWFNYAFDKQDISLVNTFNDTRSSNRLFFNTGSTTDITFDSLDDDLMVIMSTQPAPDDTLTSITDGKRVGQKLYFDNALSTPLIIPNSISNVKNSVTVGGASLGLLVWSGSEWTG